MKNKNPILIILFASILSFSSCKDDDEAVIPATVEQTNLCGKNFILTDYLYTRNDSVINSGVGINNGLGLGLYACQRDNFERYETNGTHTVDEGATKCDPTDPQTETGTWAFYDSATKLIFDPGPDTDTVNIIRNDGTVLILGGSYIKMGDTLETRATYTAQ